MKSLAHCWTMRWQKDKCNKELVIQFAKINSVSCISSVCKHCSSHRMHTTKLFHFVVELGNFLCTFSPLQTIHKIFTNGAHNLYTRFKPSKFTKYDGEWGAMFHHKNSTLGLPHWCSGSQTHSQVSVCIISVGLLILLLVLVLPFIRLFRCLLFFASFSSSNPVLPKNPCSSYPPSRLLFCPLLLFLPPPLVKGGIVMWVLGIVSCSVS